MRWSLPTSLRDRATLEIRIAGGEWEPISSGAHLLAELDPSQSHEIELRVNSAQWQVKKEGQGREGGREGGGRKGGGE